MVPARNLRLETFTLEQDGRVLLARYTAPPYNFLTAAGSREWDELTAAVHHDPTIGAVVFTGGPADRFITHFDIDEIAAAARTPTPPLTPQLGELIVRAGAASLRVPGARGLWQRYGRALGVSLQTVVHMHAAVLRMQRSGAVYLAAINGPAMGGGLEFALACDLRYAADSDDVRLGQPEILGGIIPGSGGTQNLRRAIGTSRALELILDGGSISAREASQAGLVHRIMPREQLLPEALETAQRLARRSRVAVQAAKQAVYGGATRRPRAALYGEAGGLVAAARAPLSRRLALTYAEDVQRLQESPFVADPQRWVSGDVALGPEQPVVPKL
jgi:enoyl-CoA hydratase/carnithine racemase